MTPSQYLILLATIWMPKGKFTKDHTIDLIISLIYLVSAGILTYKGH